MQTLALMSAAVLISILIGVPVGIYAGRNERFHRAITPILDAMQIVPAFAYLMPVVIIFSVGPAAAVICTLIYAIPPAVRITALGIRGVTAESVEASQAFGATTAADPLQGAAPARPPAAPARAQPDDHVRALAGRDRGPHRRQGPRRRRDERPLLEPGARGPRRHRDRDHGDRARPLHRGHRRPHRPRPPAADGRGQAAGAQDHARDARRDRAGRARRQAARRGLASTRTSSRPPRRSTTRTSRTPFSAGSTTRSSTSRIRPRSSSASPTAIGNFILEQHAPADPEPADGHALVRRARLPHRDRVRPERPAAGDHGLPDARADRHHRRLGAGDGHRLAGARRDGHRRRDRDRDRNLGSGEPARREERSGPSSTRCRRSRSSSTSSRSST